MGRASIFKQVLSWVKLVSNDKSIQKRKFYSSHEMFDIYITYCVKYQTSQIASKTQAQMRGFTGHLNKIANNTTYKQLKSKYSKETGYSYMFVYDYEIDRNINNI